MMTPAIILVGIVALQDTFLKFFHLKASLQLMGSQARVPVTDWDVTFGLHFTKGLSVR